MKTLYRTGKIRKDRRPMLSDAERQSLPSGGPIIRNATCDRCGQIRRAVVVLGCARICRQCQETKQ